MTEKEKMLAGELYRSDGDELVETRNYARGLCHIFNRLHPDQTEKQERYLRELLGSAGDGLQITPPFLCDYGANIHVGKNFYTNFNCVILDCADVRFGDDVFIGPNCGFYTAAHPVDAKTRNTGAEYAKPITVGSSVWFGAGVHVLPGVTIGSNVVIGAGSVVNKDIPDNVIAAGNPCVVVKEID